MGKRYTHQRIRRWPESSREDLINAWAHAWMSRVATWRYRSFFSLSARPIRKKKSFRRSAGRLMDQVNGPSTPDMSSPDGRIPSPAKHSSFFLFSFRLRSDANLKQTPTREREESFACNVCTTSPPPSPSLFYFRGEETWGFLSHSTSFWLQLLINNTYRVGVDSVRELVVSAGLTWD